MKKRNLTIEETACVLGTGQATAEDLILEQLTGDHILIPNPREVSAYMALNLELGRLIPDVCIKIRDAFGPQAELSLEVYHDPEIDDPYLTLYVRQEKYDQIMERIEAVRAGFNSKLEEASGYLLVTTDFARPRGKNAV